MTLINTNDFPKEARTANSTYKKLATFMKCISLDAVMCGLADNKNDGLTAPKKNAGGSISFLLVILPATQKVVFSYKQKRVQHFGN